ncbi:MAG: YchJ family metal-binding protein [Hyphomicrobiaceae bacterium]
MRCPCRKKSETTTYDACCAPYHRGARPAPTAEALMRSRYAAFAMGNADYLMATWHPSTRPATLALTPGQAWIALRVIATRTDGERATVRFNARSRIGGQGHVLEETSRFVREDGRWYYVDGEIA